MNLPEKIDAQDALKMDFIGKVQEIDSLYKQNVSLYKEGISQLNLQIEMVKNKILAKKEALLVDEQAVNALETSLTYEEHFIDKLNTKFTQKIDSLYELQNEYKSSMEKEQYEKLLTQKEHDLQELFSEIEEQELTLLNMELERINRVNLLAPELTLVKELEEELKKLELEKTYFESSQLNNQMLLAGKSEPANNDEDVVDTELLEKGD